MKKNIIIFLILILWSFVYAEEEKQTGMVVLPAFSYSQETGFAAGAFGMYFDKMGREKNPDTYQGGFFYTQKNQKMITAGVQKVVDDKNISVDGYVQSWLLNYYPTSAKTGETSKFTDNTIQLKGKVLWSPIKNVRVGPILRFTYTDAGDVKNDEIIGTKMPEGLDKGLYSGVGITADYDTRNNSFFPVSGEYALIEYSVFSKYTGSSADFNYIVVDMRKYIPIFEKNTFAIQGYLNTAAGDTPFQYMPSMGGQNIMRGFYYSRFNDKAYGAFQGEFRAGISKWIGVSIFAGTGEVAENISKLSIDKLKLSYGGGLRFNMGKEEKLNIRFDYAVNDLPNNKDENTAGMYINFLEAF